MRPVDVVKAVAPKARANYLAAFEKGDGLFQQHGVNTPLRLAHFLAQVMHESGALAIEWESGAYSARRLCEIFGEGRHSAGITETEAITLAHNGPAIFERVYGTGNPGKAKGLGNTRPGDGWRFRGGGLMQTTGGYNYRDMGKRCGVDFYNHPELIVHPDHALKPALAEWTKGKCNEYADRDDILSISRVINLGNAASPKLPNGIIDRQMWLKKLKPIITSVELKPMPAPVPVPKPAPEKAKQTGVIAAIAAAVVVAVGYVSDHPIEVGVGVLVVGAIGYFVYRKIRG